MYVRIVKVRNARYMQVVQNRWVQGKYPTHQVISSLGRYEEGRYLQAQEIIRDMQPLKRIQEMADEIKNPPVIPGIGSCRRFSLRGTRKG